MDRDYKLASEFYKKASEVGDPIAAFNLSVLYNDGKGVEKDASKSLLYAKQAANDGGVLPARVRI